MGYLWKVEFKNIHFFYNHYIIKCHSITNKFILHSYHRKKNMSSKEVSTPYMLSKKFVKASPLNDNNEFYLANHENLIPYWDVLALPTPIVASQNADHSDDLMEAINEPILISSLQPNINNLINQGLLLDVLLILEKFICA